MGVLSSVLPGLRDLRVPLAAGYIFLFDLWLLFSSSLPEKSEATGVLASLYRLEGFVSRAGFAIAISFVAYLVGLFFQAFHRRLMDLEWRVESAVRRHPPKRKAEDIYPTFLRSQVAHTVSAYSPLESDQVVTALRETVESYGFDPVGDSDDERDVYLVAAKDGSVLAPGAFIPDELVALDREGVITSLMINRDMQALYGEFDRQRSESQFRAAIFIPLMILIGILAVQGHWSLWLLLTAPVYLLVEARLLNQRAEDRLTTALTSQGTRPLLIRTLRQRLQKFGNAPRFD